MKYCLWTDIVLSRNNAKMCFFGSLESRTYYVLQENKIVHCYTDVVLDNKTWIKDKSIIILKEYKNIKEAIKDNSCLIEII